MAPEDFCEDADISVGDFGIDWLNERVTVPRIREICRSVQADRGERLLSRLAQNLPVAALALLPLLAFLLKALYPLSRRYYVEHLLLLVHYHSFLFLALSLTYFYNEGLSRFALPDYVFIIPNILVGIYLPFYLYKAMRRVYGQGRIFSIIKYLALLFGYIFAIIIVFLAILLYVLITY